jgi:hypothetical protein
MALDIRAGSSLSIDGASAKTQAARLMISHIFRAISLVGTRS